MNKIFIVLSIAILSVLVALFIFKPSNDNNSHALSTTNFNTGSQTQASSNNAVSSTPLAAESATSATTATPNSSADNKQPDPNVIPDTKSDLSIQPINPETDPANQIVKS